MDYANLGNTGLRVSRLCLGMMTYGSKSWRDWCLEFDDAGPFVERALDGWKPELQDIAWPPPARAHT